MTIPSEILEFAHTYQFLSALDSEQLKKLIPLTAEKAFQKGETIFGEGEKSLFLHLITSGEVALETNVTGACVHVQTLGRGETMGWSALTSGSRTHFQARALTPVSTIALPGDRVREACDHDPALGYELMKRVVELVTERLDMTRLRLATHETR
jgi:CRP/FNR family transcriptional regulator, cyclic AMP receptor protein